MVIATLFVPRRVRTWMVKRTTSPFNSLICSNVANKLHWLLFYCGLVKSDLRESGKPISQRWSMFQDKTLLFKPELNQRRIFIGVLLVYLSLVLYLLLVSLLNLSFVSCFSLRKFYSLQSSFLHKKFCHSDHRPQPPALALLIFCTYMKDEIKLKLS